LKITVGQLFRTRGSGRWSLRHKISA
jgi:hypothetical protein